MTLLCEVEQCMMWLGMIIHLGMSTNCKRARLLPSLLLREVACERWQGDYAVSV